MTKPRDYFTGKQEEFKRSDVQIAPYNPRKISPQQKATLKRSIRKYGVVGGITVNKNTMTIVGGNQKVAIMDEIMGYPEKDYTLLAEAIAVDYYDKHHKDFLSVTASEKNKIYVEQIKEAIKRAL